MGVDTKAIIRKGVTIPEMVKCLEKKYGEIHVRNTSADYYFIFGFNDGEGIRSLSVFFNNYAANDYNISGILLSLGHGEKSIEIMHTLLADFGGYIDENDCDDEDMHPVNIEEYNKGDDYHRHDLFTQKVIQKLGFHNLHIALELFEEFKEMELNPTK